MGSGKRVGRTAAVDFNRWWNDRDRMQIEALPDGRVAALVYKDEVRHRRSEIDAAIAAIPDRLDHMYEVASGSCLWGRDALGKPLFWIRAGAIDVAVDGEDLTVIHLSRVAASGGHRHRSDDEYETCAMGHVLSKTGECGYCD